MAAHHPLVVERMNGYMKPKSELHVADRDPTPSRLPVALAFLKGRTPTMTEPLDERRRRAAFRAKHRGTKEMDWLLGRYAESRLPTMSDADLAEFEQLLAWPDPDLQGWLMAAAPHVGTFEGLIGRIRGFHGLDSPDKPS